MRELYLICCTKGEYSSRCEYNLLIVDSEDRARELVVLWKQQLEEWRATVEIKGYFETFQYSDIPIPYLNRIDSDFILSSSRLWSYQDELIFYYDKVPVEE